MMSRDLQELLLITFVGKKHLPEHFEEFLSLYLLVFVSIHSDVGFALKKKILDKLWNKENYLG